MLKMWTLIIIFLIAHILNSGHNWVDCFAFMGDSIARTNDQATIVFQSMKNGFWK